MNIPLKIKLTAAFAVVSVCLVVFIFVFSRYSLDDSFRKYLINRNDTRIATVKSAVEESYSVYDGWDVNAVESVGIRAMEQGLILVLTAPGGAVLWDATAHNGGMCAAMLEDIVENMKKHYPAVDGEYTTQSFALYGENGLAANLQVGYYGPFYVNSDEGMFIDAVNRALLLGMLLALLLSVAAGILIAGFIAAPITKVAHVADKIAKGDYNARSGVKSTTTEIKVLARTADELAHILAEQQALRRRLTEDIEHELKTPMSALQCQIEAMIDGIYEPTAEKLKSGLEEIIRVNGLIGDLRSLAEYESASLSIAKQYVSVSELVKAAASNFESAFAEKGVKLTFNCGDFVINTDRDKVMQILVNLFSNALKYTPTGGLVNVSAKETSAAVEIAVTDNGIGIPKDELPRVFERFYRTDISRARNTGGAGIGLAVAKALAGVLGGKLIADSKPGSETVFTLAIPN